MPLDSIQRFPFWERAFRSSRRTVPEQLVGLFLFLFLSFASFALWYGISPIQLSTSEGTSQTYWMLKTLRWGGIFYHLLLPLSMWILWRRHSIRLLKLELFAFLTMFVFQFLWHLSFFALKSPLFALAAIALLWTNQILAIFLYWKKEPFSGALLIAPCLWVFYLVAINMIICTTNL